MSFGAVTQVINASRVKISRAGTEFTLAEDVRVLKTRVRDRTNTRAGAIDSFRWILQQIETVIQLTELALTQVQTDGAIDSNSAMTYNNWTINGLSISGNAADNTNDTYSATLVDSEELAPENGLAKLRIKLVVIGGAN